MTPEKAKEIFENDAVQISLDIKSLVVAMWEEVENRMAQARADAYEEVVTGLETLYDSTADVMVRRSVLLDELLAAIRKAQVKP